MSKHFLAVTLLLSSAVSLRAADRVPPPGVLAPGAYLMDERSGDRLWGRNEDTPRCMASTTKMMTALLAAESGRLDEEVIVSPTASSTPVSRINSIRNSPPRPARSWQP